MVSKLNYEIIRGRLSSADQKYIEDRAESGQKAGRIARALKRHPATVQWFMYRSGLMAPKKGSRLKPYMRNGTLVVPFSPEEDAFIEALRVQDFGFRKIADLTSKRFANRRSGHAVQMRLTMLAAREVA